MVSFTLWNYNPHNTHVYGDLWNGEDFSIFSKEAMDEAEYFRRHIEIEAGVAPPPEKDLKDKKDGQVHPENLKVQTTGVGSTSPYLTPQRNSFSSPYTPHTPFDIADLLYEPPADKTSGGRALDAVIRPYASKIAGKPTKMSFNLSDRSFNLEFYTEKTLVHSPASTSSQEPLTQSPTQDSNWKTLANTTEIYVPQFHYKDWSNYTVQVSDGVWEHDPYKQTIYWTIDPSQDVPRKPSVGAMCAGCQPKYQDNRNIHTLTLSRKPPVPSKKTWW